MSDYPSHEHIPRTPKAYMSEAAVDGEQYGVYYNNDTGGGQSTGVDSGDLPGYSQRPPAYGYNQWEYQSQPSYQQPPLYSTARQIDTNRGNHPEYNEQAERGYRVQYHQQAVKGAAINPALPTTARPVPNDMYHSAGCDDQILAIGEQFSQSVGLSESANESQGPQNVAQSNTGHQVDTVRAVDELYDTDIDARTHFVDSSGDSTANRRRYKPAVDEEESILISTVLGRAHGYQASLVHAMRQVPTHQSGHPSGLSLAIASPVDPALGYNQTATVPPPAFDAFPATQQSIAGRFGQVVDTSVPGIFLTPSALGNLNRLGSDFPTDSVLNDQLQAYDSTLPPNRTPSATSSMLGDRKLRCPSGGCPAVYSGAYASGNLARHIRMKHRDGIRRYKCEADGCTSVFNRQDARLKHYRKHHPDLATGSVVLRKASTSTGPTSDQGHMNHSPRSYGHISLCDCLGDCDMSSFSLSNDGDWYQDQGVVSFD